CKVLLVVLTVSKGLVEGFLCASLPIANLRPKASLDTKNHPVATFLRIVFGLYHLRQHPIRVRLARQQQFNSLFVHPEIAKVWALNLTCAPHSVAPTSFGRSEIAIRLIELRQRSEAVGRVRQQIELLSTFGKHLFRQTRLPRSVQQARKVKRR